MDRVDVAVVGRGAVGLAAALALSAPGRRVALIGPAAAAPAGGSPADASAPAPARPLSPAYSPADSSAWDPRVFALSLASQALLTRLGAWQGMAPGRIAPVYDMRLENLAGDALPEVHLDAYGSRVEALAWIVENRELVAGLQVALDRSSVEAVDATVAGLELPREAGAGPDGEVVVEFAGGSRIGCRLLVAADGLSSSIRDWSGIHARLVDHRQTAIVANFETERPGRDVAWQWFGPRGVVAWLPLPSPTAVSGSGAAVGHQANQANQANQAGGRGEVGDAGEEGGEGAGAIGRHGPWRGRWSLVWSLPEADLEQARARPLVEMLDAVTARRFGRIRQISKAHAFPLRSVLASTVIAPGLALVGDAAHAVHPMAGQGMNLGFGDVAALAAAVGSCPALGAPIGRESPGSRLVLRRYERSRAETVLAMQLGLSALERLFAPPPVAAIPPLASLRDAGWRMVARSPWLRRRMIRHAVS